MTDFVTALAAAGQAINLLKELRVVDKAIGEAEWKLKIAELNYIVADLKNALVDARLEAKTKDEELTHLRKKLRILNETIEVGGYHYDRNLEGKPSGYAYCPVCMQKDGYMLHLTRTYERGRAEQQCPNCKAIYDIGAYS